MTARRLGIDWPRCTAAGRCAEAAPGLLLLDDWGYPLIPDGTLPPGTEAAAALRAVRACPAKALRLLDAEPAPAHRTRGPRR